MTISPDDPLLVGARAERYRAQLLNENDQLLRELYEFSGGSYEQNAFADVRGGGAVSLKMLPEQVDEIDWGSDRIMLWFTPDQTVAEQEAIEWPLGVFLIEAPSDAYDDDQGTISCSVKIMDKLSVLLQDEADGSFSLAAGTNVVNAVRALILGTGETRMSLTDSPLTLNSGRVWEAGTPKLRVVNDLLASINYAALWCDGHGVYRAEPYVAPGERAPVYSFASGQTSIHVPEWEKEQDWFDIPNKYVLVTQGDSESPGLEARHSNVNGNDDLPYKFSIEARGRTITRTETGVEAADQQTLNALALRSLQDASSRVTNLNVGHAMMPIWSNDLVEFVTPMYSGRATVSKYSVSLTPGSLVSATWREVERTGGR